MNRYIDSPAGVGLSYSTNPQDYTTDDFQTTQDVYEALLSWLRVYPAFSANELFVAGESYAGAWPVPARMLYRLAISEEALLLLSATAAYVAICYAPLDKP